MTNRINTRKISFTKSEDAWIGKTIGGYVITDHIASGSSGIVYKAKKENKIVAIKVLEIKDYNDILRFEREIRGLASISHPNIVTLLGGGDIEAQYHFIVMELFEAKGLNSFLVKEKKFSILETIFIIKEVLQGLNAIHQDGYTHRDLKPANILYNREKKQLKIIDFGIVKNEQDVRITAKGTLVGTPLFMSPEQCVGSEMDLRSDIYSLGIIFYCLLTGKHPFYSKSITDIFVGHISRPLIWARSLYSEIPTDIRSIIEKMVQKKPQHRYQNTLEVFSELEKANTELNLMENITVPK